LCKKVGVAAGCCKGVQRKEVVFDKVEEVEDMRVWEGEGVVFAVRRECVAEEVIMVRLGYVG
jgi:hypothetical protein